MSVTSCSYREPRMPWPTMLRNAKTRVRERSMTEPLEVIEVAPAGAAGVGHGRHARTEREAVGIDAVVAGIRPPLARAGEDVHVDVDQARRHVEALHVHGLQSPAAGSIVRRSRRRSCRRGWRRRGRRRSCSGDRSRGRRGAAGHTSASARPPAAPMPHPPATGTGMLGAISWSDLEGSVGTKRRVSGEASCRGAAGSWPLDILRRHEGFVEHPPLRSREKSGPAWPVGTARRWNPGARLATLGDAPWRKRQATSASRFGGRCHGKAGLDRRRCRSHRPRPGRLGRRTGSTLEAGGSPAAKKKARSLFAAGDQGRQDPVYLGQGGLQAATPSSPRRSRIA